MQVVSEGFINSEVNKLQNISLENIDRRGMR